MTPDSNEHCTQREQLERIERRLDALDGHTARLEHLERELRDLDERTDRLCKIQYGNGKIGQTTQIELIQRWQDNEDRERAARLSRQARLEVGLIVTATSAVLSLVVGVVLLSLTIIAKMNGMG